MTGGGGYTQIVGGVISGISDGVSAYYDTKKEKEALNFQNQMRQWQFDQQKGAAEYQNDYNTDLYKHLRTLPDLQRLDLGPALGGIRDYLTQGKWVPQLSSLSTKINQQFQATLKDTSPDFVPAVQNVARTAAAWTGGEIDADTQRVVRQQAAQSAIDGGYGIGSGMGRNLVARDFGVTTMAMKERGAALIPTVIAGMKAVNPVAVTDLLLTPQQLQERRDTQKVTNWQIDNQNLERGFIRTMPQPPNMADYMTAPPSMQYKGMSPWLNAINTFWNTFGDSLSGMGGGGGAGGGSSAPTNSGGGAGGFFG